MHKYQFRLGQILYTCTHMCVHHMYTCVHHVHIHICVVLIIILLKINYYLKCFMFYDFIVPF